MRSRILTQPAYTSQSHMHVYIHQWTEAALHNRMNNDSVSVSYNYNLCYCCCWEEFLRCQPYFWRDYCVLEPRWRTDWQICTETIAPTLSWAKIKSPWRRYSQMQAHTQAFYSCRSCPANKNYLELDSCMTCPSELSLNSHVDCFSAQGHDDRENSLTLLPLLLSFFFGLFCVVSPPFTLSLPHILN